MSYKTNYQCMYCEHYYSNSSNLKQHQRIRCKKALDVVATRNKIKTKPLIKRKACLKRKLNISIGGRKSQNARALDSSSSSSSSMHIVDDICLSGPRNHLAIDKTSPVYVDDTILDSLIVKFGRMQATDFLLTNFLNDRVDKIIENSYLDVMYSDEYPMACNQQGKFLFAVSKQILVKDATGNKLVNAIINNVQNAILHACNIQIKKYLGEGDIGPLYEIYDIGKIQSELCKFGKEKSKRKIKKYLLSRVINPNHRFFANVLFD